VAVVFERFCFEDDRRKKCGVGQQRRGSIMAGNRESGMTRDAMRMHARWNGRVQVARADASSFALVC
jgi:hypothetical protein